MGTEDFNFIELKLVILDTFGMVTLTKNNPSHVHFIPKINVFFLSLFYILQTCFYGSDQFLLFNAIILQEVTSLLEEKQQQKVETHPTNKLALAFYTPTPQG